jgi:hypothetical protein
MCSPTLQDMSFGLDVLVPKLHQNVLQVGPFAAHCDQIKEGAFI